MTPSIPRPSREKAAFAGIFLVTLVGLLSVGALIPVLPRFVRGPIDSGNLAVGIVIGAYALTGIAFRPIAGRLADAYGRRPVVVAGALTATAAGACLFLPASLPTLILSRLLLGAGEGAVFTAGSAWVVDIAPAARRARIIGYYGLSIWTGLSLGPAIGEFLLQAGGYELVWAFATAAPLASFVVATRINDTYSPSPAKGKRAPLLAREALGPGAALALASTGYAAMAAFVVLHLKAEGSTHGAAVFSAFAATLVATRILAGWLPDRVGPRPVAAAAAALEAAGLVVIAVTHSFAVALIGAVMMGAAYSVLYPSLSLIVVSRVPQARRGAALGTFTGAFDLGVGLGAPIVGLAVSLGGYPAGFALAAFLSAIPAVIGGFRLARDRGIGPRPA